MCDRVIVTDFLEWKIYHCLHVVNQTIFCRLTTNRHGASSTLSFLNLMLIIYEKLIINEYLIKIYFSTYPVRPSLLIVISVLAVNLKAWTLASESMTLALASKVRQWPWRLRPCLKTLALKVSITIAQNCRSVVWS